MTLQELLAKNAATRKRREAEKLAAEQAKIEEEQEAPKKGRKPKKRAYLVKEELPFEEEVEEVEKEEENKEEKGEAAEANPEDVDF